MCKILQTIKCVGEANIFVNINSYFWHIDSTLTHEQISWIINGNFF